MSSKKSKFENDLDQLVRKGDLLDSAIRHECFGEKFKQSLLRHCDEETVRSFLKELPEFKEDYQEWYSEALALLTQTLPDRVADFESYYKYSRVRKEISSENYRIQDYLQGLQVTRGSGYGKTIMVDGSEAIPVFRQQLNIVKAAKATLGSNLLDLKLVLQADLFDSEIEGAKALAKAGFLRAAGAICGVVIEKHFKQVCKNRRILIRKKKPTIFDLNQALRENDVVSVPQWRFVQHLADIRNICDHDRGREPARNELDDLISGTSKVLKTIF